jgi:hypothetical protein
VSWGSYDWSMIRRVLVVAAVGVPIAVVTGCGAGPANLPDDGPLAVYRAGDAGMDALLEGTLGIEHDCLVIEQADGTVVVPIFPLGTASWDSGTLGWGGNSYHPGDAITAGGGGPARNGVFTDVYVPDGCRSTKVWWVAPN